MCNPTDTPVKTDHIAALQQRVDSQILHIESLNNSLTRKIHQIQNVKDYITEVYQETDLVPESLAEVARILEIQLTKPISGEATFTISWTAQVPLDFDPDDMEITFSVDCQSDVEDFEWLEESTDIDAKEGY